MIHRVLSRIVILLIRCYQIFVSPYIGFRCRFIPTCSVYAIQAIEKYGLFSGSLKAILRILRCNRMCNHGVDLP